MTAKSPTIQDPKKTLNKTIARLIGGVTVLFALIAAFPNFSFLPNISIYEEISKPVVFVGLMVAMIIIKPFNTSKSMAKILGKSTWLLDLLLIAIIIIFAGTYLHEIIVEKPELFPSWIHVDSDPMIRVFEGQPLWIIIVALVTTAALLMMNVRVWGWPIVIVALVGSVYAISTALLTYFGLTNNSVFLTYKLGALDPLTEIRKFLIIGDAHSLLGRFPSILLRIVMPFIVLGSIFAVTGGGTSLIRLAFNLTRKMRGGPAHAAILSSSLFGTMSGGPVVNVLSTGVLTIPMMLKRKFTGTFSGGVEAAASSGGQIVPPVMGIAAFFLANFTGVNYSLVIIAALIPAILYYFSLFLSVVFESRKLNIEPIGEVTDDIKMKKQDWLNLLIIVVPIAIIIAVLASGLFSVTAAGLLALIALIPLSFIDPEIRKRPSILLSAFGDASLNAGRILLLFMAVGVIDSSLSATGFPNAFGNLLLSSGNNLQTFSIFGLNITLSANIFLIVVLIITMISALILGMGMPTLPAYANVAIVVGGALTTLGLSFFTSHMFVFYFAVASAITPPVAIAAFAASSITGEDPFRTGFAAVRVGITMFIVPFIFVFYPELLLINDAFIADKMTGEFIPSRPNGFETQQFLSIIPRTLLALYLISSALSNFDIKMISNWEKYLRLGLAVLILTIPVSIHGPAVIISLVLLFYHHKKSLVNKIT